MTLRRRDGKIQFSGTGLERVVLGAAVALVGGFWAASALGAPVVVTALAATFTVAVLAGLIVWDLAARRRRQEGATTALQATLRDVVAAYQAAEGAKRDCEAVLNGVIDASPDGIAVLNLDGTIRFMSRNDPCLLAFHNPEEAVGCSFAELWPGEARSDIFAALDAAGTGSASRFQGRLISVEGRQPHLAVAVTPIMGADGRPERLLVVSRDAEATAGARNPDERLLTMENAPGNGADPSARTAATEGTAGLALRSRGEGDQRRAGSTKGEVSAERGRSARARRGRSFPPRRAADTAGSAASDAGTEGPHMPPRLTSDARAAAGEQDPGQEDEQDHASSPVGLPPPPRARGLLPPDDEKGDMHWPQGVPETAAPPQGVQAAARILLVEDADINQRLAAALLEAVGHVVDVVADGALAVTAVAEKTYDVVLMDVQMPGMDGVTATRLIRLSDGLHRDIPIIAMTANVFPEQIEAFRAAGMNDHVGKPLHRAQLYAAVTRWMAGNAAAAPLSPGIGSPARRFDEAAFRQLAGYLGPVRLDDVLARFALSLSQRFDEGEATPENLRRWTADAHVVQSLAGMTGFSDLAAICRALHVAIPGSESQEALLGAVREAREATLPRITKLRENLVAEADLVGSAAFAARAPA